MRLTPVMPDRGSATVIGAVMVTILLGMTTVVLQLGAAVVARHRAAAAADLGALAGASAAVAGRSAPCVEAAAIVAAGSARLDTCEVSGWEVRIVASAPAGLLDQRATARARAGPDLASRRSPLAPRHDP